MSTAALSLPPATPSPVAHTLRLFANECRYDLLARLRTRAYTLTSIGFPVMFYVLFGLVLNRGEHIGAISVAKYMLASYAAFGVVGASLFGIGVGVALDLGAGWLELKRASPMPPVAYLLAKVFSSMVLGVIIACVLTVCGIAFGHVSITAAEFFKMLGLVIVGALPFATLGLVIALLVPANATPGVINLVYLPMSFLGGLWVPIGGLPVFMQHLARWVPTFHLSQMLQVTFGYRMIGSWTQHILGLVAFTAVMLVAASVAFRRRELNA